MKVKLVTEEINLKNIYTLLGKSWGSFYEEDYNNLRTYFRDIIFENVGTTCKEGANK